MAKRKAATKKKAAPAAKKAKAAVVAKEKPKTKTQLLVEAREQGPDPPHVSCRCPAIVGRTVLFVAI